MKIRAVTLFMNVGADLDQGMPVNAGVALATLSRSLTEAGFEVQTTRLAIQPFPVALGWRDPARTVVWAQRLEQIMSEQGVGYISIGPAGMLTGAPAEYDPHVWADTIPDILASTTTVFATLNISDPGGPAGVNLKAANHAARIVSAVSRQTDDGFNNLRFAAIANAPAMIPFFPIAYHDGGAPRWGIAVQAADLAQVAFMGAEPPEVKIDRLSAAIEQHDAVLAEAADRVAGQINIPYLGCDWSLAPFPDPQTSVGSALEELSERRVGTAGTLWAAACLTEALRHARIRRTGYTGLMLPVLEDNRLAKRAAEGILSVSDLLLYSAVCGLGLDTVPLPGDTSVEDLTGILLDMGALAARLNKPLTARLFPVPGKQAGDPVIYGFEYFAPGGVMAP